MSTEKHSDVSIPVLNTDEGASVDRRQAVAATLSQSAIAARARQLAFDAGTFSDPTSLHWHEAQRQLIDEAIEVEDAMLAVPPEGTQPALTPK